MTEVKMKLFRARDEETYLVNVFFDGQECAGQIQTMLASTEPDVEVQGWAEFIIEVDHIAVFDENDLVMTEWREGKIKWVTIPIAYSS